MNTEPIAVVGMGAVFPGAGTAAELWRNVRAGVDAITEVPADRWDPAVYYDPGAYDRAPVSDRFYCRRGGFVDGLATFDPERFGIMPAAVPGMEPDQLLALRTAAEAIADAGGDDRLPDRARIGVVIGRGGYITPGVARFDQRVRTSHQLVGVLAELLPGLGAERLAEIRKAFCDRLGPDGPDASVGLVPNFAASRIANRFDLRGPAYTLDAACASSLVAVEHAVRALRGGQCDAMLAGAVHHAHHATVWSVFSQLRALSPSQRIRPFDRSADGTLLAEGTGMVLLKRLSDAERAGDRVHAVILGTGTSSDGRAGSIMSPLVEGQVLALERAWRDAGLDPSEPHAVGLVEAHGTATPAGDEAELATLRRVFGTSGPSIGLGTVKSMIGHAMPAAGIAGLIKAACALREGVLPPTLHVEEPHPALAGTRLRPVRALAEWERPAGGLRRAVVNAFGFGGANAHVILEEPPSASAVPRRVRPAVARDAGRARVGEGEAVLRLSAVSPEEMAALLNVPDGQLLAQAHEPAEGVEPEDLPCRLALVGPTARRLDLARAVAQRGTPWRGRSDLWFTPRPLLASGGRLAFLFPGFEPVFDPRVGDVAAHFGMDAPDLTGRTDLLGHAADVIAVGRLLARALAELGVEPDVAAGHSLGEWTAMIATELYPADAVEAFMAALDRDEVRVPDVAYAALGCGADRAQEAIGGRPGTSVSHDNCPHQSVICGPPDEVREIVGRLASEGVLGQELPFRSGFHTPVAEVYMDAVRRSFERLPICAPRVPLWSATTVAPFPETADQVRELVVRHLLEPVRFSELTEELYGAGVRAFVQVGPGSLTGFVGDRLGDRDHLAMAVNVPKRDGMAQLRRVVAALWAEGYGSSRWAAGSAAPGAGLRLDLGTPLIRLDGAIPPLDIARSQDLPSLPAGDPVMAELEALLKDAADSAQSVLEAVRPSEPGPPAGPAATGPPGQMTALTTSRVFSLDAMPYVADHCLIPQAAGWPEMSDRFPVVPLTTLLEVMADTARELFPDLAVIGFADVRALRWVIAEPATTAAIRATPVAPDGGDADADVGVRVVIEGHTEATVLLAARHPAPPAPDRTPLEGEGPPEVTAERFYAERWMFHGPRYQGVSEICALAEGGLRAKLTSLPTPGALMDSAGQLCGHWIQVYGEKDQTVFPVGIDRVSWYGPLPSPGERLDTTVRNRAVSGTTIRCDVELVRADGTVWGRVDGWTTHRFYTDEQVWRMKFTPEVSGTSEPQPGGWCLARKRWDGTSARDLLMRQYLCAAERDEYQALTPRAQGPWLLGRIAAKDAVREWLWRQGHGPLFPAELTVRDGATPGRPTVAGPFDRPPALAIDGDGEFAVALVRPAGQAAGIALGTVADEGVPPSGAERDLLAGAPGDRATAATRLRTAKRAVAAATGTDADDLLVTAAGPDRLLVAAGGRATAVESRPVEGRVVTWTVGAPSTHNDNAGETQA
ncbi:beta-ketoacyl synthase N-terminal-like domain-containing protein [Actinomadura xylanilytica]|uniref:beta-ketoacyl synthase N-terminal-like domain-containing protein n=1 Tax=Actinomadura xylanilytica TaxID=887459 RepID=UPI00255AF5CF|nr:beta-ketoacyl synthase N-terminal-like domain-containing protein [Actinomadura xylanilytica]MDL4775045.1 beta-ketoacyl synthase N-terminal-like domain-containing protein [Actinomadura xylanilytica]